jgi:hypothetical protein
MHAVTSVETNVKWNGARSDYFRPQRGIRQGDPISPYIFVMCIDKLSHLITHAVEMGDWKALRAGRRGPAVSHLMFADDLLLFGEATEDQMKCVMNILQKFCRLSGQQVSQEKTSIFFSKNTSRGIKDKLLQLSGFRETTSLGKYLGVPLLGRAPKKQDYNYIVEQVSMKLTNWKANHLSFAGRVTLAKSVMEAVPIYPMMTTIIPKACIDEIQRMQRKFIWGDTDQSRRYHAVGWNMLTRPKASGGLGLRRLDIMNKACILKLVRKLQTGSQDLWCTVMWGKYRREEEQHNVIVRSTDSHLWKAIVKLWPVLDDYGFWSIGNGMNVSLCNDIWIDKDIRIRDLELDVPDQLKDVTVAALVDEDGLWNMDLLVGWLPQYIFYL